jgi:hypothetical protein
VCVCVFASHATTFLRVGLVSQNAKEVQMRAGHALTRWREHITNVYCTENPQGGDKM